MMSGFLTETLQSQNGCLVILDTHGGNDHYNILSEGGVCYCKEAASGIEKVLKHAGRDEDVPHPIQAYLDLVQNYKRKPFSPQREQVLKSNDILVPQ
jgi:23S rRNA A2030 N6-methylase RlmJ